MQWPSHIAVKAAGAVDINGVFTRQLDISYEDLPVYGNLKEFSLSACRSPDETGQLQWGWIIGRDGVPAYGCVAERKESIPMSGWQCFQGPPPAPTLHLLSASELPQFSLEEARQRAFAGDLHLAVKAFREVFHYKSMLFASGRGCARLHVELAQLLCRCQQKDAALAEVKEALNLWPSLPEALLLKAQLYEETDDGPAALLAKQCWLMLPEGQKKLRKECQELLENLGEALDASLPCCLAPCYLEGVDDEASEEGLDEASASHVESLEVKGSSLKEVNGVYEPCRDQISNHCPSFVNGHGFRLSLEVLPAPNGEATRGWVIGKDAAGYFGTKDLDDERRFPLEDGKWSCFAAARGATAPTSSVANVAKVDSAIEKGYQARLEGRGEEAVALFRSCLKMSRIRRDLRRVALVYTELAGSFREMDRLEEAQEAVRRALEIWPGHWEAYLADAGLASLGPVASVPFEEAASIWSKLHRAREASVQLRQLLVARDAADGRAQLALLAQLERVDAPGMLELKGWMQNHGELPVIADYLARDRSQTSQANNGNAQGESGPEADFVLEDQPTEVFAHWTLAVACQARDVDIRFQDQWLLVRVQDQTLFEGAMTRPLLTKMGGRNGRCSTKRTRQADYIGYKLYLSTKRPFAGCSNASTTPQ
ncbi:unnamed protein product [Durusdinium trenchii]|uniref:Uncharacterized protein n=2 Tax=Durusdinium trenchii TaxID=1381693 RepID=A0ABP0PPM7_9DINO